MSGSLLPSQALANLVFNPFSCELAHIKHLVCMPPTYINHLALTMPMCSAISLMHQCTSTHWYPQSTLIPCLSAHDTKVVVFLLNELAFCMALPCLSCVSHAPTCLHWSDCFSGFSCAMPKSLLVATMCYSIATMANHPCAQGTAPLCLTFIMHLIPSSLL